MRSNIACISIIVAAAVTDATTFDPSAITIPIGKRRPLTSSDGKVDLKAFFEGINATLIKYHAKPLPPMNLPGHLGKRAGSPASTQLTDDVSSDVDVTYYGNATVGASTPQTFNTIFDTGSADFIVPGPNCSGCSSGTTYNQGGIDRGNTTTIQYGSGAVSGENYLDTVEVAGLSATGTNLVSLTQSMGFTQFSSEALMGLGFNTIAASNSPTFFDNLVSQRKIPTPEFSFYLGREKSNTENQSLLTLGGTSPSLYTGRLTKIPVVAQGYWTVRLTAANVNKKPIAGSAGDAAIDTGTTVVIVPTSVGQQIFSNIPGGQFFGTDGGENLYSYPCNTKARVQLTFAGKQFVINPKDLELQQISQEFANVVGSQAMVQAALTSSASNPTCIATIFGADIQPVPQSGATAPFYVVGDVFLKNWYSVFSHAGNGSVSFARAK